MISNIKKKLKEVKVSKPISPIKRKITSDDTNTPKKLKTDSKKCRLVEVKTFSNSNLKINEINLDKGNKVKGGQKICPLKSTPKPSSCERKKITVRRCQKNSLESNVKVKSHARDKKKIVKKETPTKGNLKGLKLTKHKKKGTTAPAKTTTHKGCEEIDQDWQIIKNDCELKQVNNESKFEATTSFVNVAIKDPDACELQARPPCKEEEYLAKTENLQLDVAKNIIKLFAEENTIPFIARYRSDLTGGLKPEKLRKIKSTYDYIQLVSSKRKTIIKQILPKGQIDLNLLECINRAETLEELEFISAPLKNESKVTLAERAKRLGLETPALLILKGTQLISLENFVNPKKKGLENANEVKLGIKHVIANIISHDPQVYSLLESIKTSKALELNSKFKKGSKSQKTSDHHFEQSKYHIYGNFSQTVESIRPHQMLAINRGESEGELSVKIIIPEYLWNPLKNFFWDKWAKTEINCDLRINIINDSIEDAIKRLLAPLVIRQVRARLNKEAEEEAIKVFGDNLKQLLLTPPLSGKIVMGIDPGFKNGCKLAVVSRTGNLLAYDKFFLNRQSEATQKIANLILKNRCDVIALGNGKGSRETEIFLSSLIEKNIFKPLKISYTIINEQGVSIYSCSPLAAEEFPDLDPTIVSAISLARRLQNPLSELVKIEPKHLGVGMYQHDVNNKKLVSTLDEMVLECVSFVGIDINTASFHLLKRVAGITESKAKEIIKYRSEICSFRNRKDLMKVKGIKNITFQQCSGFVRILPSTAGCTKHSHSEMELHPLDQTPIHPESYETVIKLIKKFNLNLNNLGTSTFIKSIKTKMVSLQCLAMDFKCSEQTMSFIIDILSNPLNFDTRSLSAGPIFRQNIMKPNELFIGQHLTGVVRNIVSFGAFVDVGVQFDGLIHNSKMNGQDLHLNDHILVKVISLDIINQKIGFQFLSKVASH